MFTKSLLDNILEKVSRKEPKTANYICRDELSKKKQVLPRKFQRCPRIKVYQGEYSSALKKPFLPSHGGKGGSGNISEVNYVRKGNNGLTNIRVKVVMTRKEAARLLAETKEEGTLEFKDVAKELVLLPANRISMISFTAPSNDVKLATIPEEEELFVTTSF